MELSQAAPSCRNASVLTSIFLRTSLSSDGECEESQDGDDGNGDYDHDDEEEVHRHTR